MGLFHHSSQKLKKFSTISTNLCIDINAGISKQISLLNSTYIHFLP